MSGAVIDLGLPPEQEAEYAQHAQHLVRNPLWQALLDRMQVNATMVCIHGETTETREQARQRVLAVDHMRQSINAALETLQFRQAAEQDARRHE